MKQTAYSILAAFSLVFMMGCGGGNDGAAGGPEPGPPAAGGAEKPAASVADMKGVKLVKEGEKPHVAYVTNGIASFWTIAEAGARKAEADLGCKVEVRMPPADGAVANQKRMIEELLTMGVHGMAVSPIDPDNQTDILNAAAENGSLITHDSDAPKSNRMAYVGMDNYVAGRMCGQLVKKALPEGGSVMIFVGRLEQLNAKLRRQGVIDELMGREPDSSRFDAPGEVIKNDKYTILDTRTDNFDFGAAKSQAEDAIAKFPDLGCMVGLFAYNPPYILEALKGANKLGKIQLVGFDEADETLQAIVDGHCIGTTVQNPYMYGYKSVEVLTGLAQGKTLGELGIPDSGFLDITGRNITKDNVDEFWADLKVKSGTAEK
jgi:ribose transport system substrate-binding protein